MKRIFCAAALLVSFVFPVMVEAESFEGMSYLDNGKIRIGVNLDIGGAITYLSESGSDENIINSHDWGRQIQMSFYSGPTPFVPNGKEPRPAWKFLGWNPIQSGDTYGNRSIVTAHTNDGTSLYVKCIPMHWPLNNEPGECTFEVWMRLEGGTVQVRSRLNNARSDRTQYRARGQELPALYSNGTYYRLFTYDGDAPFTGGAMRQITKVWDTRIPPAEAPGGPWDHWMATENWAALLNDDDFGVGIWTPGTYGFSGGFAGKPGSGGPKDGPTGYISPVRAEILDHNIEYDYSYTLMVGKLEDIRQHVYAHASKSPTLDYTFTRDRQSWTLRDCVDTGWPMNGSWSVNLTGGKSLLVGPKTFWRAEDVPMVTVRAAFDTGTTQATLGWEGHGKEHSGQVKFDIISDGKMRDHLVTLQGLPKYDDVCAGLRLIPNSDGAEGRSVVVERITSKH